MMAIPLPTAETILVVDDDSSVRDLVTRVLRRYGYIVYGARSGERGVECFQEHADEIALVLTDVVMPTISGPQMVEEILRRRPGTRVLFMTGYSAKSVLPPQHAKRFAVLGKPFTKDVLLEAVRECLTDCQ